MIGRRQLLAAESTVCRRLIPADSRHGVVGRTARIGARTPRRWPGPAGLVDEFNNGRPPLASVFELQIPPIAHVLLYACIHEFPEIPITDLEAIDEKRRHFEESVADGGDESWNRRYEHHVIRGRGRIGKRDREVDALHE